MARRDTWMPLDIGAYASDTFSLTTEQHGAYLLLLMDYWKSGPLLNDDAVLAATTKVSPRQWKSNVGPVVRRFFNVGGDGLLHQKRSDAEIEKAGRISNARRVIAIARHGKPPKPPPDDVQTACKSDANEMQADPQRDAKASTKPVQTEHENAGIARGHALAPPLPRTLLAASSESNSAREAANGRDHAHAPPTAENGFNGWEDGREVVGGHFWDAVWPQIVEAARIDLKTWLGNEIPARKWLRERFDPEIIVSIIRKVAERPGYPIGCQLAYFDQPIRNSRGKSDR